MLSMGSAARGEADSPATERARSGPPHAALELAEAALGPKAAADALRASPMREGRWNRPPSPCESDLLIMGDDSVSGFAVNVKNCV